MPTHYQGTIEQVRALDAFIKLTRASESVANRLFGRGLIEDLTPTQFGVLETLLHLGPMCQGQLSQKLLKSSGNTTMVIDNLEKRGLVKRTPTPQDRRMTTITLTPAGEELITRIFPAQAAAIAEEMGVLSAEELAELGRLCRKLGKREATLAREPVLTQSEP